MSPLRTFLTEAETTATELGHVIIWETVGETVANGRCANCGREVTVATTQGMQEKLGKALKQRCNATGNIVRRASMSLKAQRPPY